MAPHACTMPLLLLLLLLLPPLPALLGRCLWHSTAHHGVAQRGSLTSQSGLPTAVTALGHCPSPTCFEVVDLDEIKTPSAS